MKSQELKRALIEARLYVEKIGKPEPHFNPVSYGKLSKLEVSTQICHQAYSGATNYWNDSDFDKALCKVIRARFDELAKAALDQMEADYIAARIDDKQRLLEQLEEIEHMERQIAKVEA